MAFSEKYGPSLRSRTLPRLWTPKGPLLVSSAVVVVTGIVGGPHFLIFSGPRMAWADDRAFESPPALTAEQLASEFEADGASNRRVDQESSAVAVMANSVFRLRSAGQPGAGGPEFAALLNCSCDLQTGECQQCDGTGGFDERSRTTQWRTMHVTNRGDASTDRTELNDAQGAISLAALPSSPQSPEGALIYWRYWKDLKGLPSVTTNGDDRNPLAVFRGRVLALGLGGDRGVLGGGDVSSLLSQASAAELAASQMVTVLEMPPMASQLAGLPSASVRWRNAAVPHPSAPGENPIGPPTPSEPRVLLDPESVLLDASRRGVSFGVGGRLGGLPRESIVDFVGQAFGGRRP